MNAFQVLGLAFCGFFAIGVLVSTLRHRMNGRIGVAWLLLWVSAAVAITRPELTVTLARALGIARGADLVFYLSILAMFVGFFAVYAKFRRIERDLTTLVRRLALREGGREHPSNEAAPSDERAPTDGPSPTDELAPTDDSPRPGAGGDA